MINNVGGLFVFYQIFFFVIICFAKFVPSLSPDRILRSVFLRGKVAFYSFNITLLPSKRKEKLIALFDSTLHGNY